jgi:hypothetical protein
MKFRRLIKPIAIGLLAILVIGEVAVRLAGMVDFPLYDVDNEIGYIPKPSQHGRFLNIHRWVFNDLSMGIGTAWEPNLHPNILLVGNSIVVGGNPTDQKDKLVPLLQRELGTDYSVWPIAAGGWTNVNESVYLRRHPEVLTHARFFIWEFMQGGLSKLNTWDGEYVLPKKRPLWALWYVFRRYGLPRVINLNTNALPPQAAINSESLVNFEAKLAELSQATGRMHTGVLFLYPTQPQLRAARLGHEWLPEYPELERLSHKYGLKIINVSKYPEWTEAQHRDGVHPTVQGNAILAKILSAAILDSLREEPLH